MAKRTPWVRALAYPLEATTVITRPGFVRTDLLSQLSRNPAGEPPDMRRPDVEIGGVVLREPRRALDRGVISEVDNLHWWDLSDAETGVGVGGYTVEPYVVPRSNRLAGSLFEVRGREDPMPLTWLPFDGGDMTAEYWETCQPDAEPQTHAVAWRGTDRNQPYLASTEGEMPRGQSWALRFWWLGTAPVFSEDKDQCPYVDVIWGGGVWAVSFALFKPPALCKWVNGEWRVCRSFDGFGADVFATGEPIWLRAAHVAGRLVLELEAPGAQRARVVYTETEPDQYGVQQVEPVQVPAGPMAIKGRGVALSAQLHEYLWGRWVPEHTDEWGIKQEAHFDGEGSFSREYWCSREVSSSALQTAAFGFAANGNPFRRRHLYEGDAGSVAEVVDEPVRDQLNRLTGKRKYTCTLQAHNPGLDEENFGPGRPMMAGAVTPFVYAVAVKVGRSRSTQSAAPIDLRPALIKITEELADPQLAAGPMWQLDVARQLLSACEHQETGQPIGAAWTDYVDKYHRLVVDVSWHQADGTVHAGTPPWGGEPAPAVRRLNGFIMSTAREISEWGKFSGTVIGRDMSALLQAPAGVIDGRFAPLDLLMVEKLADGDRTLQGWEGVRYILETALGPDIAGDLVHVFPDGHYDLLTHRLLLDPPQGGFFFPPPWGQSAYQWIMQLAERDFAVFFWRGKSGDPSQVVPYYANYFTYLQNVPEVSLPDAVYVAGDQDELLTQTGSRQDPRHDYNRVLVWGAPPGQGSLGGVMPALRGFSAEARIERGSPVPEQNIEDTWERTQVMRGSHFWLGRVARIVALNTARLIRGVDLRGIRLRVRGNPYLWWGYKVRPKMEAPASDSYGLELDGQLCRAIRINNIIHLEKGQYDTTLRVAPEPETT